MVYSKFIDYAILRPTLTPQKIIETCKEALRYRFFSVCVPPVYVKLAKEVLAGSEVKVGTVIGFPLGYMHPQTKLVEAEKAVEEGAQALDIVIQIGWAKAGNYKKVVEEIDVICDQIPKGIETKAILELPYFSLPERRALIVAFKDSEVEFLKTATGFGPGGATLEDVKLMREIVGETKRIKAAGGIKDAETFLAFLEAGANRIGTSSGPALIDTLCSQTSLT